MTHEAALTVDDRISAVLRAAAEEARVVGLAFITRDAVARRANVPAGSLGLYGSMAEIKRKVAAMQPDAQHGDLDRYQAGRAERDKKILVAALDLAAAGNYRDLTRAAVADRAGVSPGTVSNYAVDMDGLRVKVMTAAVARRLASIVAQGLAVRDPIALAAPDDLKTDALATLTT